MKATLPFSRTRNKQVRRVLRFVALMQDGYWTPKGAASKLGCSVRTAQRDLAAIRYEKVRLVHDGVRRAWRMK